MEKRMRDEDFLLGVAFEDEEGSRLDVFKSQDEVDEFIEDNKTLLVDYSIYEMRKVADINKKVFH